MYIILYYILLDHIVLLLLLLLYSTNAVIKHAHEVPEERNIYYVNAPINILYCVRVSYT